MASSFSKCWNALLSIREKAINESTPNSAQAIDKASLNVAPTSSEDATTTTPLVDTPGEAPAALVTRTNRGKGRKTVGSGPRRKRSLEKTKVEAPRK